MCDALGRIFEKMEQRYDDNNEIENSDFKQGMGHLISGMGAHVASKVIMANMASFLTILYSRFLVSHDTSYIFVKSIQDYFEK